MTLKTQMKKNVNKTPKRKSERIKTPKKEKPEGLKLSFEKEYDLNQAKVSGFVDALLKVHEGKKNGEVDEKTGDKKSQLFGAEETPVNLQVSGIKVPKENRRHLLKIVLPHVPIVDSKDICIITKDLQKGLKVDHEDTVNHFKDLLSSKGVEVSSVISLRELKVEYKQYEAKTALCHRHEAFLADEKIIRFLPKFLGKAFYKRRKFPIGINLESKNLSKEVEKALRTVNLPLSNMGTCSMIRIGHTNMKANHLTDNILQTTEILSKKYPGGWKNVRSIHLKTETSMSIPIHISDISANEIGFVDTSAAQKKKRENITDDLSTVLGGEVTITPNFDIRLKGAKMPKDEDDVIESEESDNENEETADKKKKAESKAEKKAEKKDKTVSKKRKHEDSDEDEDDKDMTKAEDEYLKRNAEQDEEEKDEEDEEGSGDEEEEIVDDDEESGDEEEDAEEGSEDDEQQSEEEEDESEEEEVAPPPKKAKKSKGIAPPPKKAGKSKGIAPPPKKARKSKK